MKRKKRATCGKGHNNWSYWISGTDGKKHRYCKTCRQPRAKKYSEQKKNAEGSHTKKEWEQKESAPFSELFTLLDRVQNL